MARQVPAAAGELLRTRPRQMRSSRRIHLILDTAAQLFDELGYENTTTKHVAERAGIAVGSVYHWFPDKTALASALSERYLDELLATYRRELFDDPHEPTFRLVRRVVAVLARFASDNPAFVALLVAASAPGEAGPADRLRRGLYEHVLHLVTERTEDVAPQHAALVADTLVTIVHALMASIGRRPMAERAQHIEELGYVVTAYLAARFPARDDPIWAIDDPVLAPFGRARQGSGHGPRSPSPRA